MAGRPSEYRPEFSDTIIDVASRGGSARLRAVKIGVHPDTYYAWCDPESPYYHADFHEAHLKAEALCYAWWEEMGTSHLVVEKDGPRLDPQVYRLNMMNRFGWGEKQQQEVKTDTSVTLTFGDAEGGK